jgi:hypothetical protein
LQIKTIKTEIITTPGMIWAAILLTGPSHAASVAAAVLNQRTLKSHDVMLKKTLPL